MDIKIILKQAGGVVAVAKKFGLSRGAVSQWDEVPAKRVLAVSAETGWHLTPHQIRPDIYPNPTDGLPPHGLAPPANDASHDAAA